MPDTKVDLDNLTPAQKTRLTETADKWAKIFDSTEQSTQEQMRTAVDLSYRCADMEPPLYHYFCSSPVEGSLTVAVLQQYYEQFPEDQHDRIHPPEFIRDRVQEYMDHPESVPGDIEKLRRGAAEWMTNTPDQPGNEIIIADFLQQEDGTDLGSMAGVAEVAHHCGCWWPMENIAVVTSKPVELHIDEDRHMHNPDGMAIKYPDDVGLYFWHGVMVEEQDILQPETITNDRIEKEYAITDYRIKKIKDEADTASTHLTEDELERHRTATADKIKVAWHELGKLEVALRDIQDHHASS